MNIFHFTFDNWQAAALAGVPAIFNIAILLYLLVRFQKTPLVLTFILFVTALAAWQTGDTFARIASTPQTASFWSNIFDLGSILIAPAGLHFTLYFTDRRSLINSPLTPLFLYLPVVVFEILNRADVIASRLVHSPPWGFIPESPDNVFEIAQVVWIALVALVTLVFLFHHVVRVWRFPQKRAPALLIATGFTIPTIQGVVTQVILPLMPGFGPIPITSTVMSTFTIAALVALTRFKLFQIPPDVTANLFLKVSPTIVATLNPDGTLQSINPAGAEILGIAPGQLAQLSIQDLFTSDRDFEQFQNLVINPIFLNQRVRGVETTFQALDGRPINVSVAAAPIAVLRHLKPDILIVATDISKLKTSLIQLEQALKTMQSLRDQLEQQKTQIERKVIARTRDLEETEARLYAALGSLPLGLAITDQNNNIITINGIAVKLLCSSRSANYSTSCTLKDISQELKGAVDLDAKIQDCLTTKRPFKQENIPLRDWFINLYLSPVILSQEVIGTFILIEDVTTHRKWEQDKDDFFSIAAHELRTPLTVIRGNTDMIINNFSSSLHDPNISEMLSDIHGASIRLIEIVNDFLDVSRIEQKRMVFRPQVSNLVELIETAIHELTPASQEKHLTLEFVTPDTVLPPVLIDPARTKQVLVNLIGNSIKFTSQGKISVAVKPIPQFLKVFVTNTGPPISPDGQKLLFKKFQQSPETTLTYNRTGGSGMGLYISKLIVQQMGGEIKLEYSDQQKGTAFSFTVPLANQPQATIMEPRSKLWQKS